jgi:hypothetical protein
VIWLASFKTQTPGIRRVMISLEADRFVVDRVGWWRTARAWALCRCGIGALAVRRAVQSFVSASSSLECPPAQRPDSTPESWRRCSACSPERSPWLVKTASADPTGRHAASPEDHQDQHSHAPGWTTPPPPVAPGERTRYPLPPACHLDSSARRAGSKGERRRMELSRQVGRWTSWGWPQVESATRIVPVLPAAGRHAVVESYVREENDVRAGEQLGRRIRDTGSRRPAVSPIPASSMRRISLGGWRCPSPR